MRFSKLSWAKFKSIVVSKKLKIDFLEIDDVYWIFSSIGSVRIETSIEKNTPKSSDQIDFENNYILVSNKQIISSTIQYPFNDKVLPTGQKLFRRKHGNTLQIESGETLAIDVEVDYGWAKLTDIEVTNCLCGDIADVVILDSENGIYQQSKGISPITPFLQLNQFGFDVAMCNNFYKEDCHYDADLILGMIIRIIYENKGQTRKIGFNVGLHEVV
jgi:hypothetical protein